MKRNFLRPRDGKRWNPALALTGIVVSCLVLLCACAPTRDARQTAEEFVGRLAQGNFEAAEGQLDEKMAQSLTKEQLKALWGSLIAKEGAFKGLLRSDLEKKNGKEMVVSICQFEKAIVLVNTVLTSDREVSGLWMAVSENEASVSAPPPYTRTKLFSEQQVVVGDGMLALPGTLSVPTGPGPWPAVVLVHGSGPNDRDETVGPNKPFRDLAWGLASKGVAVLRYEKRTRARPEQCASPKFTVNEETVDDAVTALELLRHTARINPTNVFVLGHSLGGMLVPRIAAREPKLAGAVILGGGYLPVDESLIAQADYIVSLAGTPPAAREQVSRLKVEAAKVKMLQLADAGSTNRVLGSCPAYWLDLRNYNPAQAAKEQKCPLLILHADRDFQVTQAEFQGWQQTLAGRPGATFKSYPQLNHLFLPGTGPSSPAEYEKLGYVAEEVIDDIVKWVVRR